MKMNYGDIANKHRVLLVVGTLILPRVVSTAIARNITKFEKELVFVSEQRKDIAMRFAKKDEKGQFVLDEEKKNYTFDSEENMQCFLEELNALENCEVDVDVMRFHIDELLLCDTVEKYDSITPLQEASISWMIDYE